jgi:host factor-I protein
LREGFTRKSMAKEHPPKLQDTFLVQLRDQRMPLTIFLVNGVKLQGLVASFDGFTVLLVRDGFSQLKHAISTMMPAGDLKLYEG